MIKIFQGQERGPASKTDRVYIQLDVRFREVLHLFSGARLHVFLAIALHMDEDGIAFPSYDTLMRETGYGRATIARTLDALCEIEIGGHPILSRWRERDEGGQYTGSNRYKVFPDAEDMSQSSKRPTLEKSNGGLIKPEQEPVVKEKPKTKIPAEREKVEQAVFIET